MRSAQTQTPQKAALHNWSLSMRHQLKDTHVEVIERAPPGVQTDLMPGQTDNPQMMPLDEYIAEVMGLLRQEPALEEICVERVKFLREAEQRGAFAQVFGMLNEAH
ncbi:hypothetical protein [Sphingobium chungbukense]|uniref:hypothetical protein n=1 Tax=Sphingobium chungbukense TaxID=56193 RepID=UPI000B23290F|nr:hypothetical protein [Sphingobium chungbukense]